MSVQIKHQTTEIIPLKAAFEGLSIGFIVNKDDGTAFDEQVFPDFSQVFMTLVNKANERKIFSMSLEELHRMNRKYDMNTYKRFAPYLEQSTVINATTGTVLVNKGLNLDVYDGDYELQIETRDAFAAGTRNVSYMEVTPIATDEGMTAEVTYIDETLDRKIWEKNLGNGIEEIFLYDVADPQLFFGFEVERASYTSPQGSANMQISQLVAHTLMNHQDDNKILSKDLVLHDGEILNDCVVRLEMSSSNNTWKIMYKKVFNSPNSAQSVARAEMNRNEVYSNL
jgi:hypothetical protein